MVRSDHRYSHERLPSTPDPTPVPGAINGLTLSSDSPGTLTVSWDAPSPQPTDYRLRWAQAESDYPSWKDDNETDRGNEYPGGGDTSLTLSGLTEGTEFKVRVRARYNDGAHEDSPWSGPWTEEVRGQPSEESEERELTTVAIPPVHMAYAWWDWDYQNPLRNQQSALNEITVEIEIHNDIELNGAGNGIYLMVCQGDVDGIGYYFGLQTDMHNYNVSDPYAGKGLLFSRWGERDLENTRIPGDGWTQSSGHEGNFIGVRRNYDWGSGKYLLRIGQDGPDDSVGRWYGLWITDLAINQETWIGSMRFPYIDGRALLGPRCYNTVEIYGPPIAPRDIPYWKVTLNPPKGDGMAATVTDDGFSPFTGGYRNARISYDENGAVIYEVGLDHIPANR